MTLTADQATDHAAVIAVERAWVEAIRAKDLAGLAAMLADEYIAIGEDGRVFDKTAELAGLARPDRWWDFAESDEYDVRIHGDAALLIGRWRAKGVNGDVAFDYAARFVAVYVRQNGQWRLAFNQSTAIPGLRADGSLHGEHQPADHQSSPA